MPELTLDQLYEKIAGQAANHPGELMYWETRTADEAHLGRIAVDEECTIDRDGLSIPLDGVVRITWNLHYPPSLHSSSVRESSTARFYRQTSNAASDPLSARIGDAEVLAWLERLPIEAEKVIYYAGLKMGRIMELARLSHTKQTSIKKYARQWVGLNSKYFSEMGITKAMFV